MEVLCSHELHQPFNTTTLGIQNHSTIFGPANKLGLFTDHVKLQKKMSSKPNNQASAEFTSYYLQRATQELSEDLDKVRNAEDFKADSIPFLVHALQQGAGLFSAEDQKRVVDGSKGKDGDA
ncbi:hypothetical protein NW767_003217 [Fusarium falciforme]|nr:hypothetical protein NW767_003217 [Fusarium falciforme]